MADTICVDPDAMVYGAMGAYGIHQKQSDFILSAKMQAIRSCANGYITPDMAASMIIQLQNSKPLSVEDGEKMASVLGSGLQKINEALRQQQEAQMLLDKQRKPVDGNA